MLSSRLTIVAVIFASVLLGLAGLVVGYFVGYADHAASGAAIDAAYTAQTARSIREGKIETAIALLETKLDSQIVEHSVLARGIRPTRILFGATETKTIRLAALYRFEFPSQSPDQEVRTTIQHFVSEHR